MRKIPLLRQLHTETPLIESLEMGEILGSRIYLKMEVTQPSGSFKNRGIGLLCKHYALKENAQRFISPSGGNAGLAVAHSGRLLGVPVEVFVPDTTTQVMIDKIKREGATVHIHGHDWDTANQLAQEIAAQPGNFYISPFDHPLIWKGNATLIHEVKTAGLKPDAVVLAVGGGGLLCGVCEGLQACGWGEVPIFAAETEGAASFAASVTAQKLVTLPEIHTLATSLGVKKVATETLKWAQKRPIYPKVVTDRQAVEACLRFADQHRYLTEPACGAALSIIYEKLIDPEIYKDILVIVCGGCGVTTELLMRWGRQVHISPSI